MERIDFQHSTIRWITDKEGSIGIFTVESVLCLHSVPQKLSQTYALSSAVLAGNMYSNQNLAIDPPYLFQIAGDVNDHVIFRTYLHQNSNSNDTIHKQTVRASQISCQNQTNFKSFELNLNKVNVDVIDDYDVLYEICHREMILSGALEYENENHQRVTIDFPIKHINLLPENKRWQLETGPILFPGLQKNKSFEDIVGTLVPCFVHANQFDRVFITADFPFNIRGIPEVACRVNHTLDCKVYIFAH